MILGQPPPKKPSAPSTRLPKFNFWSSLGTVLSVAIVVASLFTFWTPASLFSNRLSASLARALDAKKPPNRNLPTQTTAPTPHIGLVAGHWGDDTPGYVCPDGTKEADINLAIATLVRQKLLEQGYTVDLLKEHDDKLRQFSGLLVVSIHADTCDYIDDTATGYKVAPSYASSAYPEKVTRLTACMLNRYEASTGMIYQNLVTDDMTKFHTFDEVNTNTPVIVMETGYLNLDKEFLTKQQDKAATGISDGILCYLRNQPLNTPQTGTATP